MVFYFWNFVVSMGCSDSYSTDLAGSFVPGRLEYFEDSCGLEATISQLGLVYNFGAQPQSISWDSGFSTGNMSADMWEGCYMNTGGSYSMWSDESFPSFYCSESLLFDHVEALSAVVVERGLCSESEEAYQSFYGYSDGMFVNKDQIVLSEEIGFNCYESSVSGSYQSCSTRLSVMLERVSD
ncbi:MAG: hypothetical protein CMK59_07190 [Proteobacteria bacterium]|nr:hypothetical protein [Pseudomonadota bacterium]